MLDSLSIAFYAFVICMLTSISVDDTLLPGYMNDQPILEIYNSK